jgi:hypothetical protein
VRRHFPRGEGYIGCAADAPNYIVVSRQTSHVERRAALQIGKLECGSSVAAVIGSDQGEYGLILVDGERLPIAQDPAPRGKIEADKPNFR